MTADLHKLSAGRADYYTREIARNREEYLSGHGESPGEHLGGSAVALGLAGTCSAEEFKRLFAWQHPETGEQLGRPPRTDAMPAWDLVLRPTKSVSVLYGLGDELTGAAVLAAHKHAVREAVAYLDDQVGTRRGRHGAEHVQGSGLLATGFVHRTSRAGDPLLHTHLIIHNRTLGPDGQWRTLDSRDLLNHRAAADAVYRAAYQQELSRTLGVRWTQADRWGNRELVGMPDQVIKQFSKRHEQITAELQRLEREEGKPRTGRLVQLAVHSTREPKQRETPETLYGRWQDEARTLGVEPERLVRDVTGRAQLRTRDEVGAGRDAGPDRRGRDAGQDTAGLDERTIRQLFDHLAGPEGLTEQASTFAHRDVLTALGGQLPPDLAGQVSPNELARLADRFLAERATSVMPEHAAGERRYATPELLSIERRLIHAAVGRAEEQTAVCSHDSLRAALAANSTIGDDQAAMVRDITQGGAGVAVVVGKPGTGKTYALGVARHAWQLEGYRVVGTAPTGIAAVCLGAEGFEDTSTVDRLLAELDQEHATRRSRDRRGSNRDRGSGPARWRDGLGERGERLSRDRTWDGMLLDRRTVLVVDEAAMLGSRKLDRLLDHAQQAKAKVVLVGDDRQLASIEAGGGFRGLRLRLGASTLTVNHRQRDTWQRQAAEDARNGDVDAAVRAYREHDRMVSTETPTQAKQAMLADWWPLFQASLEDPGKPVAILTRLRGMADEFNSACQQLRDQAGQLGPQRLQVGDRVVAVGDLVVCGKNALAGLGVANGSRGQVVAVDQAQRQLTLRLEGKDGQEVTLPRGYLDERPRWWTRNNPERRTIDLGYATTGHKAQGLTREHALVYVSGAEDRNWYEVQDTRARGTTRFYGVTHPEPRTPELDVPHAERGDVGEQMAQGLHRDGSKLLALDVGAAVNLDLRGLPTHQLRAERHRLARLIAQAPPDQTRLVAHTADRHQDAEHRLAAATGRAEDARALVSSQQGTGRLLRRRELAAARDRHALAEQALVVARQQADRAADRARQARHAQAEHEAWMEDHADILIAQREAMREDGWRRHARRRATELLPGHDRPAYLRELGEPPASVRGRRAWRRTLAQVEDYRQRFHLTDPERPIGEEPHGPGVNLEQRQAWRTTRQAIEHLHAHARVERARQERAEHGTQQLVRQTRRDRLHERDGHEREAG